MELDFKTIVDKPVLLSGKDSSIWIMDGGVTVGHLAFAMGSTKPDSSALASLRRAVDANVGWVMDLDVVWTTTYGRFIEGWQKLNLADSEGVPDRRNTLAVNSAIFEKSPDYTETYVIWHNERTPTMVMYSSMDGRLMLGAYDPDIKFTLESLQDIYKDHIAPYVQPGDHRLLGGEPLVPPVEEPKELAEAVMDHVPPTPPLGPKRLVRDFIEARRAQGWRAHHVAIAILLGQAALITLYHLIF